MTFEEWFNKKFPYAKGWMEMYPKSPYKQYYEDCWKAAQKETLKPIRFTGKYVENARKEARKEMAKEIKQKRG